MDFFEGYFRTLGMLLPRGEREDILRELSEEIRSQVAEKEAKLARPLNPDEKAAILGHYGHPLLTAARYMPQRYLIGPVVFPYYWLLLKITLGLIVMGHTVGAVVLLAGGMPFAQMSEVGAEMAATVLKVVGWITVLAAIADWRLTRSRVLERWHPGKPSPLLVHMAGVVKNAVAAVPGVDRQKPPAGSRSQGDVGASVPGFLITVVVSAWWLLGLKFPYLFFGPGAADLSWGAAIDRLFPVLVAAQLTVVAEHFLRLTHPRYSRFLRPARVAWLIAGWFFIYLVATSNHEWIVWGGAAEASVRTQIITEIAGRKVSLVDFVNYAFSSALILAAIGGVLHSVRTCVRWYSQRGHRPAAA